MVLQDQSFKRWPKFLLYNLQILGSFDNEPCFIILHIPTFYDKKKSSENKVVCFQNPRISCYKNCNLRSLCT